MGAAAGVCLRLAPWIPAAALVRWRNDPMKLRYLAVALLLTMVAAVSGCAGCCHKAPPCVSSAPPCGCPTGVPAGAVPAVPAPVPAPVPAAVPSGYGAATCPTGIAVR
jgi:hypothetical protein